MTAKTTAALLSTRACYHSPPLGTSAPVGFRQMLASLLQRTKGARGAIFCDSDGESVDVAVGDPQLSDFDMKVLGAHAAAWLAPPANVQELKIRCSKGTLLCRSVREGYYLVLLLGQDVPAGAAAFELLRTAAEVSTEL